jgi:2-(1,2-epoxy-1,2-dihydrophenyl)acetyl-CoA isomerase
MSESENLARQFADGPTRSLGLIKQAMYASAGNDLSTQLDLERDFQRELGRSEDFREGVTAFLAKRKPAFKGK